MSDTDQLRHAAKLLRERAQAATPGPWHHLCMGSEGCAVINDGHLRERRHVAFFGRKKWKADHADAEYVASIPPAVTFAVADWLEECSRDVEGTTRRSQCDEVRSVSHALTVARAYLGRTE